MHASKLSSCLWLGAAMVASLSSLPAFADAPRQLTLEQRGDPSEWLLAHRRGFLTHPTQSTGYWARKGEALSVNIAYQGTPPNLPPELWLVPIANANSAMPSNQVVQLRPGLNQITAQNDGVIYFAPRSQPGSGKIVATLQSGGREIPRFVLGQNSKADWSAMLGRLAAEPYAELVGKRMIVTMPLPVLRQQVDDPSAAMTLWDRIVTLAEEQYGLAAGNPYPHAATPFQYQFVTKPDSSGGYMSASNYWLGTNVGGAGSVANSKLLQQDGWGPWHELGHHYQMPAMTWNDQTEVTVNLTSLYVQRALGQRSRLETGGKWDLVRQHLNQAQPSYDAQADLFVRAAMFWQLDLAFGKDFYSRLGQRYRSMPFAELPAGDEDKRQRFIIETSRVAGHNLTPFFDKWGLKASTATRQTLSSLALPALSQPIWLNRDESLLYRYPLEQQGLAGRVSLPAAVDAGRAFSVEARVSNAGGKTLRYQWQLPPGFGGSPGNSATATLTAPAQGLQGAYAPIRVTVSDGVTQMTLGSAIQLRRPGAQSYDAMILAAYNKGSLQKWSESRTGAPGDVYVYDNPYRNTRDYFQLKTARYGYFPTDGGNNAGWQFLDSYNGAPLSATQSYDLAMLTSQRKSRLNSWSESRTGTVGDVYVYDNPYRSTRDYFVLKNANYGYFPTTGVSNSNWTFIGAYDGSQYLTP
ncbi:M60 family metallopeptidase [Chromobacterium rhizoryzae]|uniref:Peptidase M60 domain-containing protein n=1 Tax=Chromobacterium rhizoryzae TaxID=1778675 RepID=A0AAD0RUZ9_9NEIS|nr:M60 family metallopeptidase [Chromobacterium rhizoryzae]AXT48950.1 hypothetical protein D1345_23535 [Chromobacterium rhizoryzae]